MYAVIFKAKIKKLDSLYSETAERMQQLARQKYGCTDFVSSTDGEQEIAISYWRNLADIQRWRQDPEHLQAQKLGARNWYQSYQVEVVEVKRAYDSEGSSPR